ncbi:RNA polymerase sigma factor SigZ [Halobacteriovorax marinus]|uniref:RNA polymerase sigma factor n=1 Tax=Halobacteriovorax marinus TaxID=97084 RepID=A0A1Y5F8T7_9BACT|nr:RNA polymerase sigma factor SigZ [Halobacteriovorax marinus]
MQIEKVWGEYKLGLKGFIHSKIANPTDAEDLLQEVLIKTFQNLHKINSQESIKSWIFQVANNAIIDHYRRNGKYTNEMLDEKLIFTEESEDAQKELSKCIEPFIRELPKETCELLTAIDLDGESQKAYAEAKGIKYTTLKSRVKKGREELRALFENCCTMSLDKDGNIIDFEEKPKSCNVCK